MEYKKLAINDIEFLKSLGHEMNTQDNDSQADPRFWVVAEYKREYGYDDGYCDGTVVIDSDGEFFDTPKELIEHLIENECVEKSQFESDCDYDFSEILNMIGQDNYSIVNYREIHDHIAPNTMFLTKQECKHHIKLNDYHYTQPHTYAMTAWRSPQVERLYNILKNTDWNEIASLRAENERLTRERDSAIFDVSGDCEYCKFVNDCAKHDNNDSSAGYSWYKDCDIWEWRGLQE